LTLLFAWKRLPSQLLFFLAFVSLLLPVAAAPPKPPKKILSAQEAGAASMLKVQLRKQLLGLGGKMRQVRDKIHAAKVQENRISESIETVQARIGRTRDRLARVKARLQTLAVRHDRIVERLQATEGRLALRRRLLGQRLNDDYQRGQTTYAHVLLQSRSLHDLMSRGYYVRQIVHSDTALIEGVKQDIVQIKQDKAELEAQEEEQRRLAAEYEAERKRYLADLERQQELLQDAHQTRALAEDELDDLERESAAMTARIRQLQEALRRRQEAIRRANELRRREEAARRRRQLEALRQQQEALRRAQRAQNAERRAEREAALRAEREAQREIERLEQDEPEEEIAPVWRGGFQRPTTGRVTSGFGYRYHPILHRRRMHTGVDFGAPHGSPIFAAGDGTVILAEYNAGYGNCVIIDHGGDTTTLYGHCSVLRVREGQIVRAGQVIALVGSTGLSTGPHLHFEVRKNGVPVRPPF
jgi:murein DD-endopeptidase MepM/ murein hydrolase activator NlpD